MGGDACVTASWPSAGAAPPRVKPPANVAPLFKSSRRLKRFEPIGLSFADEPKRKSLARRREYTPGSGSNRASPEWPWTSAPHRGGPRNISSFSARDYHARDSFNPGRTELTNREGSSAIPASSEGGRSVDRSEGGRAPARRPFRPRRARAP